MSASQAVLGYGSTFSTGVSTTTLGVTTTTYTEVAEINSINFEGFSVSEIDVTSLSSPDSMMESIPSLLKPGTISLSGNYTGVDSQQTLTTLGQARTIFPWQIVSTLGTGSTYTVTGNAFVSKLTKGPIAADKKIDFAVTLQVSGAFTEVIAP